MFSAPIPGQSLTSEPKNVPWENPPQFPDPESALLWHMDRLEEPDRVKATLGLLELGLDVVTLTEGIVRAAVLDGRHSIDVSLLIAPIIHEYIVGNAEVAGIEYDEGLEEGLDSDKFQYDISETKARKILKDMEGDKELDLTQEMSEDKVDPEIEESETPVENKPMGLMTRGEV